MHLSKKFLHNKTILLLVTLIGAVAVVCISWVILRFDAAKNPTTIVAYRPSLSGSGYVSGKPLDIYLLAVYMLVTAVLGVFVSAKVFAIRHQAAVFVLVSTLLLLVISVLVANSLISLQ